LLETEVTNDKPKLTLKMDVMLCFQIEEYLHLVNHFQKFSHDKQKTHLEEGINSPSNCKRNSRNGGMNHAIKFNF
jgi:hypothetical protein